MEIRTADRREWRGIFYVLFCMGLKFGLSRLRKKTD
jgi:hypothetical protein